MRLGLVLSVLFHLVVLWPAQLPRLTLSSAPAAPTRLQGVLRATPAPAAVPAAVKAEALPLGRPVRGVALSGKREPGPTLAKGEGGRGVTAGSPAPGGPKPAVAPAGLAPLAVAAPAVDSVPAAPADAPADANALRDYRFALARAMALAKRYPTPGLGGTVVLGVSFEGAGLPGRASVLRSSGHRLIDEQARRMLELAMVEAVVPTVLQGRRLALELPVEFDPAPR